MTLKSLAVTTCLMPLVLGAQALAQNANKEALFDLGTIVISDAGGTISQGGTGSTVDAAQITRTGRATLDDALRTVPGVTVGNTGGSRNERMIYVRGFDRFQVPLSIDGIRVYLPADNRLDFGRFLTPDLAEIQVQKGYVSVLNGPGGMGGAINLVTRKPTESFEGEARLGLDVGNRGDVASNTAYLSMGSRQELFYVQSSYLRRKTDGFYLSRDYMPRPEQAAGLRDYSDTEDSRFNFKFGITPNATDEYVLSVTRQTGSKNAPYNVDQPIRGITPGPLPAGLRYQRDWEWPEWDINSLTFYTHTDLSGSAYVKTKAYYNTFDNTLSSYDDVTHSAQTGRPTFNSVYDDKAYGVSLELGSDIGARNRLKGALHYRLDEHRDTQHKRPGINTVPEDKNVSKEQTLSVALENTFRASEVLSIVAGLSYDRAEVLKARRTATAIGFPTGSSDALNWQIAAIYEPKESGTYHASVSSRTRFATLFNRYSTRFGSAVPNPDLKPERALNFEIGYSGDLGPVTLASALFYSKVSSVMESVPIGLDVNGDVLSQTQNAGDGKYGGFEVAANWDINNQLSLMANYTCLNRRISDPVRPGLKPTDTPEHNINMRLDWQATDRFSVAPSIEMASSRLSESAQQPADPTQVAYTRNSGFGLANLDFEWQATDTEAVVFGVRNLFDKNYELVEGFPEAGRTIFVTTSVNF